MNLISFLIHYRTHSTIQWDGVPREVIVSDGREIPAVFYILCERESITMQTFVWNILSSLDSFASHDQELDFRTARGEIVYLFFCNCSETSLSFCPNSFISSSERRKVR